MPLLKYVTLAVALSRVAAEGPCVDEPDATLPNFYDDAAAEAEEPAAQPAAAAPESTEAEEPAEQPAAGALEPEPTFEKSTVAPYR